jgi:CO dehydrogenase maturation factor
MLAERRRVPPGLAARRAARRLPGRTLWWISGARATTVPGVKIAIAGKGGSGKTTIAGTLARLAAGRGTDVLAIDADLNPNLALTLGIQPDRLDRITPLPHGLLEHREVEGQPVLRLSRPVEELVLEYGIDCPGKVRLLLMGRPYQAGVG